MTRSKQEDRMTIWLDAKLAAYIGITFIQCNFELFSMLDFYDVAVWANPMEDGYGNVRRKG